MGVQKRQATVCATKNEEKVKSNPPTQQTELSSKTEESKYIYDLVNRWIENADNKVSVSCGVFGGVYGILAFLGERITGQSIKQDWFRTTAMICFFASAIIMGISIFFYVLAINPNLISKSKKTKQGHKRYYPVYYGDIAGMELDHYLKAVNKVNTTSFIDEIQREIHINSRICLRKMKRYRIGIWTSFAAIILATISLAARYLMYR